MAINFLNNVSVVETAASSDTDKFVVLDSGVLKYRTGAQVRSDIGAGTGSMSSWIIKEGNGTESTSVTNGETFTIAQGTGIQSEMTSTSSGGTITITNTDRGSSQNIFKNFAVSGQSTVVADSNNDTITLATTGFLTITTDATTDTITLNNTITNNNQLTNGAGYITSASLPTVNNGTLTMTTSTGLDGGATFTANQSGNSAFSVSLDLSELTDMTAAMTSTDEFIVLDSGAERRKAAGEIGLSIFNNNAGFITSSSSATLTNKSGNISQWTNDSGYITGYTETSTLANVLGRGNTTSGTDIAVSAGDDITLTDSSKIIMDTNFQIYKTIGNNAIISETGVGDLLLLSNNEIEIKSGELGETYAKFTKDAGIELYTDDVKKFETTTSGVTITGDLTVTGGDIILNGTGRIQGIDTVSAGTDATNKTYVDNAIAGVPQGDITAVTAGTNLTGGGTSGAVTLNMATGGIGSGTYGSTADGTKIDNITVDAYGRVTAITTGATGSGNGTVTGSGTTNYVSKWTSSTAQGNSTIYDNGNVGIGTTTPGETLTLQTQATGLGSEGIFIKNPFAGSSPVVNSNSPFLSLGTASTSGSSAYNSTIYMGRNATATDQESKIEWSNLNAALSIYVKGTGTYREHVRFGNLSSGTPRTYFGGNVGIGTTSPATDLEIEGGDHLLQLSTTSSTGSPYLSFNQAGTRRSFIQHADSSDTLKLASEYGGIDFYTGTSGTETEKMTIQSDGDVGINVTSPSSKLHVRKAAGPQSTFNSNTIGIYETSGPGYVNIITGATSTGELWFSDSSEGRGRVRYDHSDDSLQFWVANGEKLRVGVSGQIGIGGANYGSSGQVLTSNGSGSAPSWQAAGGSNQFASGLYVGGTTAAHLLDDYEEGTYTPTFSFSYAGGLYPMTAKAGRYQKIGNKVFVDGYVKINGFPNQTPTFNSVSLPFTVDNTTTSGYAIGLTNSSWDQFDNDYFCRALDNTTTLNFPSAANGNNTTTAITYTDYYTAILYFQITYRTS